MIQQMKLQSRWLHDEKRFFVYGDTPLNEWKHLVFSWHEETFYGTMVESATIDGHLGALLSPWEALTFFACPPQSAFVHIEWDETSKQFQTWAMHIVAEIEQASFMPDFQAWKRDGFGWKKKNEDKEHPFLTLWRMEALNDWIRKDRDLQAIWDELIETYPLLQGDRSTWSGDELDWLMDIGWGFEQPPFIAALQLFEPERDSEPWRLETVLIDRATEEAVVFSARALKRGWEKHLHYIERSQRRWQTIVPSLSANGKLKTTLTEDEAWRFLTEDSVILAEEGVRVLLPSWWDVVKEARMRVKARVKSTASSSLFGLETLVNFDWRIATNGVELTEEQFAELVKQKRRLVRIRDRWIQLDPTLIQKVQTLMKKAKKEGLPLRDVLAQAFARDGEETPSEEETIEIELNRSFASLVKQLTHVDRIPPVHVPASFIGTLRSYQQRGVDWLIFLRRFGFGACLADDMGLGKTVQMLAYFAYVKETERPKQPALLICPTSVIGNWQKECNRFVPMLRTYVHHGANRAKQDDFTRAVQEADVVITSYSLTHLDFDELSSVHWHTICLDEAQNIKNAQTKQARAIRKLTGGHKIALSGTPIENRLNELWSIFHFLNPGYLGSQAEFQRRFATAIEKNRDREKTAMLQKLIRPFLLRRTKTDERIALDLPDKLEQKEYCPLTIEQASLYEQIVQHSLEKLKEAEGFARRGIILQMLNHLKQLCNHPALYLKEEKPTALLERSHKLEKLVALVEQIRANEESCLIFTQYIQMGEMIQHVLRTHLHEQVVFLNGSVPKQARDRMIEQFQNGEFNVFILSLKAGGTGLNLTAANHVIHFDRWWNPAVENQATDRAYRIGQQKFVHVHKLITTGTIEEKIDDMLSRKQALNEHLIESDVWITELSDDELRDLLTLQPTAIGGRR